MLAELSPNLLKKVREILAIIFTKFLLSKFHKMKIIILFLKN